MPEGENPNAPEASIEDLRRENRELRASLRETNAEARDHRLERNEARKQLKDLETQFAELKKGAKPSAELDHLRRENRQLRHRGAFDRAATEAGVKASGKARDTLFGAMELPEEGEVKDDYFRDRIEAARADYDFLFDPPPAGPGETPAKPAAPARPETPAARPGPGGTGRGAPADGAGTVKVRRSDLQSF